jgi:hypothetical protein
VYAHNPLLASDEFAAVITGHFYGGAACFTREDNKSFNIPLVAVWVACVIAASGPLRLKTSLWV